MAEKIQTEKKAAEQRKIVCKGPKDKNSGAEAIRLPELSKKDKPFDIYEGQTLVVGRDVPAETADKLLKMDSWKFEEVK
ncbi:hypothetical protein [Planomicrobium sp. CPCC 101079]|uniref:hypothetical protein n=1 Tax=Planomicrobium sp. CPCC 101079 TaxID=2599618 RepID=UPI0011B53242|nr:hypothetical protein [Planomicrobium sp. CPCC 101079]TWT04604.1 hypothetical protein FQV28_08350 [Planomicrobium sp. CPCC 101079]